MAEDEGLEKLSIRNSVRSNKKYGSTSKHLKRQETLVKHIVQSTDTLQGIALKYGVSMEQIRRTNKLWTSDSLFLREHLMIPLPSDSPMASMDDNYIVVNNNSEPSISRDDSIENEPDISDFLSHIDHSIATTKKDMKRVQGKSEFTNGKDLNPYSKRKVVTSRLKQSTESQPHTVPMVVTQTGRKLRSSLQRLEQTQDEIFEL